MRLLPAALRVFIIVTAAIMIVGCSPTVVDEPEETAAIAPTDTATIPAATETATLSSVEIGATNYSETRTAAPPTRTAQAEATAAAATAIQSTIAASLSESVLPFAWPLAPLTDEQVNAARECAIRDQLAELYPETLSADELFAAHMPEADCEWATIAVAFGFESADSDSFSEQIIQVYSEAFKRNPAYTLSDAMLVSYFSKLNVVDAPPFASQPIISVRMVYTYAGIGNTVDYTINITQVGDASSAYGTVTNDDTFSEDYTGVETYTLSSTVDSELVQTLGASLTDLVPISDQVELNSCSDHYPDWTVTLTYEDGTTIDMVTNTSNLLGIGGPWQTSIEGKNYIQVSFGFAGALLDIIEALELPLGHTAAMNCGENPEILEVSFPE